MIGRSERLTHADKFGVPLEGRDLWKVSDVFSDGNVFKYANPATPDYALSRWYGPGLWVIFLRGNALRGRGLGLRIFKSALSAAIAAEQHFASRLADVRAINEAQRASESRDHATN